MNLYYLCNCCQKSFYSQLCGDKKSEAFFKVFYDRLTEAQLVIKANMSAAADNSLVQTMGTATKERVEHKCKFAPIFAISIVLAIMHQAADLVGR